ncbi:MAG: Smr/MutS family protein [Desulfobulbales bacterium]|nr:Smr/MutS family protein [Desulfobulbales bacterium]
MAGKKKNIPRLDREDFYSAFGAAPENEPSFPEELEKNLARTDIKSILREKGGPGKKPLSDREKLQSYPPPQEELDLHGHTGGEAERKTANFIRQAAALKYRTIRIITGKGLHSDGPAVLPDVVEGKLQELQAEKLIFAFAWEKGEKHRSGAVLVYLPEQADDAADALLPDR